MCGWGALGLTLTSADGTPGTAVVDPTMEPPADAPSRPPGMFTENIGSPKREAVSRAFWCMPLMSGVAAR